MRRRNTSGRRKKKRHGGKAEEKQQEAKQREQERKAQEKAEEQARKAQEKAEEQARKAQEKADEQARKAREKKEEQDRKAREKQEENERKAREKQEEQERKAREKEQERRTRERLELEQRAQEKRREEERMQHEQEERQRQACEVQERQTREEQERRAREERDQGTAPVVPAGPVTGLAPAPGPITAADPRIETIFAWVEQAKAKEEAEKARQQQVSHMQGQLTAMANPDNTTACSTTGVNMFANLETINQPGGTDLVAKAQMVTAAASAPKRPHEENPDSDGEYNVPSKSRKLQSGLTIKTAHRVRVETEWAHHNLGREFEANPVAFNQLKLGQYMLGEAEIMINCKDPVEIKFRLNMMRRLAYWQHKYDWPSARNVYAAVLRCIEVGKETWSSLNLREFEEMLVHARQEPAQSGGRPKKTRDTYFCSAFQRGECGLNSPHQAKVGIEGPERLVHHICSTCLLKDGKKLNHAQGASICPRVKSN